MHEAQFMGLLSGPTLVLVGGLVWGLTSAGSSGELTKNAFVGIRTSATAASPRAWTAGHRAALPMARRIGVAAVVLGVILTASAFLPIGAGENPHPVTIVVFTLGYGIVLIGSVLIARTASRAARSVSARQD